MKITFFHGSVRKGTAEYDGKRFIYSVGGTGESIVQFYQKQSGKDGDDLLAYIVARMKGQNRAVVN
jgi:hypothetical protein